MSEHLGFCDVKAEKVGVLPLEIDMVARCNDDVPLPMHMPLMVQHFATDNLLEYKSAGDKTRKEWLSKLLGYVGLYGDQHGISIKEMRSRHTVWYITAKHPAFLDGLLEAKIASLSGVTGVYTVTIGFLCPCNVVVCDELAVTDDNMPLLMLGSIETIETIKNDEVNEPTRTTR